jgi:hypothetical protein
LAGFDFSALDVGFIEDVPAGSGDPVELHQEQGESVIGGDLNSQTSRWT